MVTERENKSHVQPNASANAIIAKTPTHANLQLPSPFRTPPRPSYMLRGLRSSLMPLPRCHVMYQGCHGRRLSSVRRCQPHGKNGDRERTIRVYNRSCTHTLALMSTVDQLLCRGVRTNFNFFLSVIYKGPRPTHPFWNRVRRAHDSVWCHRATRS